MNALPPQIETAIVKVDEFISKYPSIFQYDKLDKLEKKTGQPKVYFFLMFSFGFSSLLYFLGGAKLITDLVSFIYPAYMSFKAIDSTNPVDNTQWLTYWVVFSFVSIIENVADFLVDFIPFYFFIKVGFFVWLYHPKFLGAGLVYSSAIKPFVIPYVERIGKSKPAKKVD